MDHLMIPVRPVAVRAHLLAVSSSDRTSWRARALAGSVAGMSRLRRIRERNDERSNDLRRSPGGGTDACGAAAGSVAPARRLGAARRRVTTSDIQRLQDQVYQASNDVSRLRSRDQATRRSRSRAELDELRDEVVYLQGQAAQGRQRSAAPTTPTCAIGVRRVRSRGARRVVASARPRSGDRRRHGCRQSGTGSGPSGTGRLRQRQRRRHGRTQTHARDTQPSAAQRRSRPGRRSTSGSRRELSSDTAQVEDRFEATTVVDLYQGNDVLIPAGSVLRGVVSSVEQGDADRPQGAADGRRSTRSRSAAGAIRCAAP